MQFYTVRTQSSVSLVFAVSMCAIFSRLFNTQLAAVAMAAVAAFSFLRLVYRSLLPKPIPGVPHNPISSIRGDIPQIMMATAEKSFSEYLIDEINKHGPMFQVGVAIYLIRTVVLSIPFIFWDKRSF